MDIKACYRVLRLKEGVGFDEVKKSFRQLAFQLHPDLNPSDPHASRHFQRINEAYVTLKQHLEAAGHGPSAGAANGPAAGAKARPAYEAPSHEPHAPPGAEHRKKSQNTSGATASQHAASGARATHAQPGPTQASRPEDVLQDILKDPFARQVFEDIYSQIRQSGGKGLLKVEKPKKVKKLRFQWGETKYNVDLTDGLWQGAKSWFRSWMDEEQDVHLPATVLKPGSRVRIHLRQGWSNTPFSVEIALPPDYIVGRPIRLKGLGRKFGPWIGDLFVRLLVK